MSSWPFVPLGNVANIERNVVDAVAIEGGTLYVGLENIHSGGEIIGVRPIDAGELASSKFLFSPRHLLYGKLRPYLAKVARPSFSGICSTDILPVLPGSRLDRNYLAHVLLTPAMVALAGSRATGANLPRLAPRALAEVRIPLPPLPEQRRIAEILDKADALRAKRRAALAQLDALTQSIFLDMFGDPRPDSGLAVKPLDQCAEVVSGVAKGRRLNGTSVEVPYLRVANVQAGFLDLSEIKVIDALPDEVAELTLQPGDVLLTEGGDHDKLGRGAMWEGQIGSCIHQNHVFRVRPRQSVLLPRFFHEFLQTPVARAYFLRCAKRTTNLASINMTQLRALLVPLPLIELQREFARRVTAVEKLKTAHRTSLAELEALFASLQHRAFRGEL